MRTCRVCGVEKDDGEYYVDRYRHRPRTICKKCENAEALTRQRAHRSRTRMNYRRYYARHAKRLARRKRDPAKERARSIVRWAVLSGRLHKPKHCEQCGSRPASQRLHAHHADYDKPLDVTWLCSGCHRAVHAEKERQQAVAAA